MPSTMPPAAAGGLDRADQRDVVEHLVPDRCVAAGPSVGRAIDDEELTVAGRQRRSGRALGPTQGQGRQPRPLQQRLHQSLGGRLGELPRVGADQVETAVPQQIHGCGDGLWREPHVGVDEHQHACSRGSASVGELVAGVRLAEPARRQRPAGDERGRAGRRRPRGGRRRRCRRSSRRRAPPARPAPAQSSRAASRARRRRARPGAASSRTGSSTRHPLARAAPGAGWAAAAGAG